MLIVFARKTCEKILSCIFAFVFLLAMISTMAIAETASDLIPKRELWGISREALKESFSGKLSAGTVGEVKYLKASDMVVDTYPMDAYFLFNYPTYDSTGYSYHGLSKIVYLLSSDEKNAKIDLGTCYHDLVSSMESGAFMPDSSSENVTRWKLDWGTIEIGKGKFKKYNGLDKTIVAIVITANSIEKPVTPKPTVRPTPRPTPTFEPVSIEYSNALRKAHAYLDYSAFSYKGLIEQLEYEGYSHAASKYAADNCGANWKEEAAKKAKSYLSFTAFSRKGLIEQLKYEGFTHKQAVYGAQQNGY